MQTQIEIELLKKVIAIIETERTYCRKDAECLTRLNMIINYLNYEDK